MNHKSYVLLSVLVFASLVLAACGGGQATPTSAPVATQPPAQATQAPASTEAPAATGAPAGGEKTATIGFTSSLTGSLNVELTRQNNGLKLWMDQVNNAGGIHAEGWNHRHIYFKVL